MPNKGPGSGQLIFHQGRGRGLWGNKPQGKLPRNHMYPSQHTSRKKQLLTSESLACAEKRQAHRVLLESRRQFARAAIMQPRMSNEALGLRPKAEASQEEEVLPQHESCPASRAVSLRGDHRGSGACHTQGKLAEARSSEMAKEKQIKST